MFDTLFSIETQRLHIQLYWNEFRLSSWIASTVQSYLYFIMAIHVVVVITKLDGCAFQWIKSIWNRFRNSSSRMGSWFKFLSENVGHISDSCVREKKFTFFAVGVGVFSLLWKFSIKCFSSIKIHLIFTFLPLLPLQWSVQALSYVTAVQYKQAMDINYIGARRLLHQSLSIDSERCPLDQSFDDVKCTKLIVRKK